MATTTRRPRPRPPRPRPPRPPRRRAPTITGTTAATEAGTASAPDPFTTGRLQREAARARTEELFVQHGRLVAGLCRGLLRDAHEGEDAAQQAFLSAYRALLRGDDPREPAAWMAAIARNECLSRIRQRMREPLPVEDPDRGGTGTDPLDEALRRADLAALWQAVAELAPQQREALLLREFGGLSYDELGGALGVSVPAVESLLFRARSRLRERLETAAAALSGAGWLSAAQDAIARLGAAKVGALPVTAKAITAALGIAAAAGGAAVAVDRQATPRHRPPPAAVRVAAGDGTAVTTFVGVSSASAAGLPVRRRSHEARHGTLPESRHGDRAANRDGGGGDAHTGPEAGGGDSGGGIAAGSGGSGDVSADVGHTAVGDTGAGGKGDSVLSHSGDGSSGGGQDGHGGQDTQTATTATTATTTTATTTTATTTSSDMHVDTTDSGGDSGGQAETGGGDGH